MAKRSASTEGARARVAGILATELLRRGQAVSIGVTGTSMLPALWPGDRVRVGPVDAGDVRPGEVVLFSRYGRLFAHRVVGRLRTADGPLLITRGDRLRQPDPPVGPAELLGRVAGRERAGTPPLGVPPRAGWRAVVGWLLQQSDGLTRLALWLRSFLMQGGRRRRPRRVSWSA